MTQTTRRRVLQLSGAGAVSAATGGLAGILASGRAPAFAQGTTLHWVRGSDYVPVSDQTVRTKINEQCQKDLGIKINLEGVDGLTIQARVTSAVSSGSGPDIISAINNWAQLYGDSVVDVSDVAEEIGKAQGGYYETAKAIAYDGTKWLAVPNTIVGLQIANRASWWNEIGYGPEKYPATWEEWREAGKKLKAKGHPLGQTLAHAFGDANAFWYPYLWSWGGKEVEADGKTVVLNSKETIESVKFAVALWKDSCDEGALAWDDSGNNRAFLSGTISATNNGASIYIEAKKKPDTYQTADGKPLKDDIFHTPLPKGPAGQFSWHVPSPTWSWPTGSNKRRRRTSCAGSTPRMSTSNGGSRSRASRSAPPNCGRTTNCGRTIRSCCRSAPRRKAGGSPAMPGRPPASRPRSSRSTSFPTCMRRRCRACRRKTRSRRRTPSW
jgi:multiple sugar transport system substrate-binding protein